jgi:hypothetical protein
MRLPKDPSGAHSQPGTSSFPSMGFVVVPRATRGLGPAVHANGRQRGNTIALGTMQLNDRAAEVHEPPPLGGLQTDSRPTQPVIGRFPRPSPWAGRRSGFCPGRRRRVLTHNMVQAASPAASDVLRGNGSSTRFASGFTEREYPGRAVSATPPLPSSIGVSKRHTRFTAATNIGPHSCTGRGPEAPPKAPYLHGAS